MSPWNGPNKSIKQFHSKSGECSWRCSSAWSVCNCQLSDESLFTLSMDVQGRLLGVGSQNGSVTLIEPSETLVEMQGQERSVVSAVRTLTPSCR